MSTMRGFEAAQRAYDNMLPPEDGPRKCNDCMGSDHECATCDGFGWLLDGEPFDKQGAENDAELAAEYRAERWAA